MEGPGGTFHNNEKYDKINTWTSSKPMPIDRHGLVAVSVDDKVYVIVGGLDPGGSQTNLNEIFNLIDLVDKRWYFLIIISITKGK